MEKEARSRAVASSRQKIKHMFKRADGPAATKSTSRGARYEQTEHLVAQRGKFESAGDLY